MGLEEWDQGGESKRIAVREIGLHEGCESGQREHKLQRISVIIATHIP